MSSSQGERPPAQGEIEFWCAFCFCPAFVVLILLSWIPVQTELDPYVAVHTDREKFKTKVHQNGEHRVVELQTLTPSVRRRQGPCLGAELHIVSLLDMAQQPISISCVLVFSTLEGKEDILHLHCYDKGTFSDVSLGRADIPLKQLHFGKPEWYNIVDKDKLFRRERRWMHA